MKGINELRLNESTMMEAIEYWLTNQVFNPQAHVTVTGVQQLQNGEFRITLLDEVSERKE